MRALVVEDDSTSRAILQRILGAYGDCDVAANGKEALEKIASIVHSTQRYDLICLDIMMPEIDGREVLREIRKIEQIQNVDPLDGVKIIMTTSRMEKDSILGAFRDGCEAYLTKPLDRGKLVLKLREFGLID